MSVFRSIVFSSVIAGIIVGVLVTLAHQFGTVPLILKGEVYEQAAEAASPLAGAPHDHARRSARRSRCPRPRDAHEHGADAWEPSQRLRAQCLHRRRRHPHRHRFRAAAVRRLCPVGPQGHLARGLVLGSRRLRGVHAGARPRPLARAAGHAGDRARPAPGLVDRHRRRHGLRPGPDRLRALVSRRP